MIEHCNAIGTPQTGNQLKTEKHIAIDQSINRLRESVGQLTNLAVRISGGGCGVDGKCEEKPRPSLSLVLDITPAEIDEMSNAILRTKDEIEQMLFG